MVKIVSRNNKACFRKSNATQDKSNKTGNNQSYNNNINKSHTEELAISIRLQIHEPAGSLILW